MDTVGGLMDDGFRCSNVNVGVSADGWGFADMSLPFPRNPNPLKIK